MVARRLHCVGFVFKDGGDWVVDLRSYFAASSSRAARHLRMRHGCEPGSRAATAPIAPAGLEVCSAPCQGELEAEESEVRPAVFGKRIVRWSCSARDVTVDEQIVQRSVLGQLIFHIAYFKLTFH